MRVDVAKERAYQGEGLSPRTHERKKTSTAQEKLETDRKEKKIRRGARAAKSAKEEKRANLVTTRLKRTSRLSEGSAYT